MKVVIGLGNPGTAYAHTRHNLGFMVLDHIADGHNAIWRVKPALKAEVVEIAIGHQKVLLAKPTTLYNASGEAAQAILHFYKLTPAEMIVVHDELDLPFGSLRTRIGGRDAGNNGIKNIITHVGEVFGRIRIGTANDQPIQDRQAFVLARLTKEETVLLPRIKQQATHLVEEFARGETPFAPTSMKVG